MADSLEFSRFGDPIPPGGIVLDPYAGSGTTGVACQIEGFGFIGIELNPDYVEIARQRIDAETPSLFARAQSRADTWRE